MPGLSFLFLSPLFTLPPILHLKVGNMQNNHHVICEQRIKSEPVTSLLKRGRGDNNHHRLSNMAMKSVEDVSHHMQHIYEDIDVKGPLNITPVSGFLEHVKVSCHFRFLNPSSHLLMQKEMLSFVDSMPISEDSEQSFYSSQRTGMPEVKEHRPEKRKERERE